jgi:hypothetical protein
MRNSVEEHNPHRDIRNLLNHSTILAAHLSLHYLEAMSATRFHSITWKLSPKNSKLEQSPRDRFIRASTFGTLWSLQTRYLSKVAHCPNPTITPAAHREGTISNPPCS